MRFETILKRSRRWRWGRRGDVCGDKGSMYSKLEDRVGRACSHRLSRQAAALLRHGVSEIDCRGVKDAQTGLGGQEAHLVDPSWLFWQLSVAWQARSRTRRDRICAPTGGQRVAPREAHKAKAKAKVKVLRLSLPRLHESKSQTVVAKNLLLARPSRLSLSRSWPSSREGAAPSPSAPSHRSTAKSQNPKSHNHKITTTPALRGQICETTRPNTSQICLPHLLISIALSLLRPFFVPDILPGSPQHRHTQHGPQLLERVDDFLADSQKLPCTFNVDVPNMGQIQSNGERDVKALSPSNSPSGSPSSWL